MTDGRDKPPDGFEKNKPGTNARTEAEADIEALRQRGGLFVEAVARTRMPMAVTDARLPGNPIVFANDAFLRLSGYSMEEVLGQKPHFLNGPDTDPDDAARFREALRRGEDIVVDTWQYRKDGSPFYAAVFVSPIADDEGAVIQHFLSYLDITRRVEAEQRIRTHASELERAVAESTRTLAESEERLRRDVSDARVLQAASAAMIGDSSEDQAEASILSAAVTLMRSDAASIQMLDEQSGTLTLLSHVGFHPESAAFWTSVTSASGGTCGQALARHERIVVEDILEDEIVRDSDDFEAYRRSGIVAMQTTPLITRGGKLIGMMSTHWRRRHRAGQREFAFFDVLARQAADLIERRSTEAALRESEERRNVALAAAEMGTWDYDLVADVCHFDARAREMYNLPSDTLDHRPEGVAAIVHPDDTGPMFEAITKASDVEGDGRYEIDYRIAQGDGSYRWLHALGIAVFEGEGADRRAVRIVGASRDVTLEKEAEAALRESEERLRLIVENARDYAIFTMDLDARVTDWREGAEAVFGYSRDEMIRRDGDILFTPEDNEAGEPEKERAIAASIGKAPNVRWHVCKDGHRVFIEGVCTALHDAEGKLTGFLKVGRDATERHAAEERQLLLVGELQHRVRNTLGVIRSIARRTAANSESMEDMSAHLEGRIDAFARVQAIVTRRPDSGVELAALVEDELVAHGAREGQQVRIDGPAVILRSRPAETISLALHELATNAVKYGALTSERGRLRIMWTTGSGRLRFEWIESGVPISGAPPKREGFGFELLRRVVPYDLSAETDMDFTPDGLHFTLDMPLEDNVASSQLG